MPHIGGAVGIIDTVKDVAVLVQKADNIDLVKHVLALQTQVQEMLDENRALKVRIQEIEKLLTFAKTLKFKAPFYLAENDNIPLCARCWEVNKRAVHVVSVYKGAKNDRWDCPECKYMYLIDH